MWVRAGFHEGVEVPGVEQIDDCKRAMSTRVNNKSWKAGGRWSEESHGHAWWVEERERERGGESCDTRKIRKGKGRGRLVRGGRDGGKAVRHRVRNTVMLKVGNENERRMGRGREGGRAGTEARSTVMLNLDREENEGRLRRGRES